MLRFLQVRDDIDRFFEQLCEEKDMNISGKDEAEIYAEYIKQFIWVKI